MKQLFYTLLTLLGVAVRSDAQQVIWSENFEYYQQSNFSSPWSVSGNSGSYPWQCGQDYIVGSLCFPITGNTTRMAGVSDIQNWPGHACEFDHNDSNVLLVTPPISLTGYSTVVFRYDSYFTRKQKNGRTESATVEISTDGGNSWTVLKSAPVSFGPHTTSDFINISAYAGSPSVRLGFRYCDSGQHMTGWMIDNLQVFSPVQHDLALISVTPADSLLNYKLVNDSSLIGGKVLNMGSSTITSFTISYKVNGGAVFMDSVTGIGLAPFDTMAFQHHKAAGISALGRQPVTIWTKTAGDLNLANDTSMVVLHGTSFMPRKVVAIEEGSGTWYSFAPQGHVYMEMLRTGDDPVTLISMHDQDAFAEDMTYMKYLENFRGSRFIPFFYFDRSVSIDPGNVIAITGAGGGVYYTFDSTRFFSQFDIMRYHFGFADISLKQYYSSAGVSIEATVKPAIDLSGAYRVALVLTEDNCKGTTPDYNQANLYAGGGFGAMGGYESLPNPVPATSMTYNSIGRGAFPGPNGDQGSLPITMTHGQSYVATLNGTIKSGWVRSKMHAIVLLVRQSDSAVLNSAQIPLWPLAVTDPNASNSLTAAVYPNPATGSADLLFEATDNGTALIAVTDISGKLMLEKTMPYTAGKQTIPIRMDGWSAGLYFITVKAGGKSATMKLVILAQ